MTLLHIYIPIPKVAKSCPQKLKSYTGVMLHKLCHDTVVATRAWRPIKQVLFCVELGIASVTHVVMLFIYICRDEYII